MITTPLVLSELAAATITYNGVQFGGIESQYKMTPPTYKFRGQIVYDDSGRAVKGTRYSLSISTIFYHNTTTSLEAAVNSVRNALSQPRQTLIIKGLGFAFDTIWHDQQWGPRPVGFNWSPIGPLGWELAYEIEFFTYCCSQRSPNAFTAFNFNTTWQNDYEGVTTRTIVGYGEVAMGVTERDAPVYTSDILRDQLTIVCPIGFRRTNNLWRESDDKKRLDFVVVDEVLPGTPPPVGCISAQGEVVYASDGPAFNRAFVTLNMSVRTSPSAPPGLAGIIFMSAAKTKQEEMQKQLAQDGEALVQPKSLRIRNGKFDDARSSSFSMSWLLTKTTGSVLRAAGIWDPVGDNDYTLWRASIENLYNNRGAALVNGSQIHSNPEDGVVIDPCDNITSVTIGNCGVQSSSVRKPPDLEFSKPKISQDGGWLKYDAFASVVRKTANTNHVKARSYIPTSQVGTLTPNARGDGPDDTVPFGGSYYSVGQGEEPDIEYHGLPVTMVAISFVGIRLLHKPVMPEIKTVNGLLATPAGIERVDAPRVLYDSIAGPVWMTRGYRIYRINGIVDKIKSVEDTTSVEAPKGTKTEY